MKKTYDHQWDRLAKRHLRMHPMCVMCDGKAELVDHIVPVKVAPWRRLDPTNLQSLCWACHNRITSAYEKGNLAGACDDDGMPLDPGHPWAQTDNATAIAVANDRPKTSPVVAAALKRMAVRQFVARRRHGAQ